jgi:hypothetical protein
LRAEGFFCNLDVLYGGLGIGKLQFLIKNCFFFSAVIFFQFLVNKALDPDWIRIRIGIQPKMLDPDPDEMNVDPQPWNIVVHIHSSCGLHLFFLGILGLHSFFLECYDKSQLVLRIRTWYILTPGFGWEKLKIRIRDEHPASYFRELRNNFL